MDHDEYSAKLAALRAEYSDSIKAIAHFEEGYTLIQRVETEAAEYRLRVEKLMNEYRGVVA